MRPRPRVTLAVVLAIVYSSLLAYQPILAQLMQGIPLELDAASPGVWQYVREGLLGGLVLLMVNGVLMHQRATRGATWIPVSVFLALLFVAAVVCLTVARRGPEVAVYGLRYLFVAAFLALLLHYGTDERRWLLTQAGRWLKPYLLIQAVFVIWQVRTAPPVYGTNFLGSRAWGTFPYPNSLGLTMLGVALVLLIGQPKQWALWLTVPLGLAFSTGRAGDPVHPPGHGSLPAAPRHCPRRRARPGRARRGGRLFGGQPGRRERPEPPGSGGPPRSVGRRAATDRHTR